MNNNYFKQIIDYHPYITENDIEKIYQRNKYSGLLLFQIDNRIIDNLKIISNKSEIFLKDSQSNTLPAYRDNTYNITFISATAKETDTINDGRIFGKINIRETPNINIINYIKHDHEKIIIVVKKYVQMYCLGKTNYYNYEEILNCADLFEFLDEKISDNKNLYNKLLSILKIEKIGDRLIRIIKNYHTCVHNIDGTKNSTCVMNYNQIVENRDANLDSCIAQIRKLYSIDNTNTLDKMTATIINRHIDSAINNIYQENLLIPRSDNWSVQLFNYKQSDVNDVKALVNYYLDSPDKSIIITSDKIGKFKTIDNIDALEFCGTLLIPLVGHCMYMKLNNNIFNYFGDTISIHIYFIYYNRLESTFVSYDYRGNMINKLYSDKVCADCFSNYINRDYVAMNSLLYNNRLLYRINNKYIVSNDPKYKDAKKVRLIKGSYSKLFYFYDNPNINAIENNIENLKKKFKNNLVKFNWVRTDRDKKIYNDRMKRQKNLPAQPTGFESVRDAYKMKGEYMEVTYNYMSADRIAVNKLFADTNNKIIFLEKNGGSTPMIETDNYIISKISDTNLNSKILAIIESYQSKTNLDLEEIKKINFKSTLSEPTETEVLDFLKDRQNELKNFAINNPEKYIASGLNKLMTDSDHIKCDYQYNWVNNTKNTTCEKFDKGYLPHLKQYFPETFNVSNADYYKPFVLGYLEYQNDYKNCQKYFSSKYAVPKSVATLKKFNWSFELNKAVMLCRLKNIVTIFPFVVIDPQFDVIGKYYNLESNKKFEYVGILSIPYNRTLNDGTKIFQNFIFYVFKIYDDDASGNYVVKLFDHRKNLVRPGNFFANYRVTFVEINMLYQVGKDLHCYLYQPSAYNSFYKKIYLFSKYSRDEIRSIYRDKYSSLFTPDEINVLVNDLVPVNFIKNKSKVFTFEKVTSTGKQRGGVFADYNNNSSDGNCSIDYTFTDNQPSRNDKIYPIEKQYFRKIDMMNKLDDKEKKFITNLFNTKSLLKNGDNKLVDNKIFATNINKKGKLSTTNSDSTNILLYEFFYSHTINHISYYRDAKIFDKKSKILLIPMSASVIEATCFYKKKYFNQKNFKSVYTIIPSYTKKNFNFKYYSGVFYLFNAEYELANTPINNYWIDNFTSKNKKFNYIYLDLHIAPNDINANLFREFFNTSYFISLLLLTFKNLSIGGNLRIMLTTISSEITIQILYFTSCFFDQVSPKKYSEYITSYESFSISFYNYKGIDASNITLLENLIDELYDIDPTGYSKYNILDHDIRKKYGITTPIPEAPQRKFIDNFCKINTNSEQYTNFHKFIVKYNADLVMRYKNYLDNLEEYIDANNNEQIINYYKNLSMTQSINIAKKLDLEIKPSVLKNYSDNSFQNKLTENIYSEDNPINFTFLKMSENKIILNPKKIKLSDNIKKITVEYYFSSQIIDTRDPDLYDLVKKKIRFYEQSLGDILKNNYNIHINHRRVSRAWIKFFEILHEFPELTRSSNINSSHFCEAPGTFINCLLYKTKLSNKKLNWSAQSLKESKIYDDYGLIKAYPNNWDFGADGTGDITSVANILYYKKKYSQSDLITADCGVGWDEKDTTSKLEYCMILLMLGACKIGGNIIFKTFMPIFEPSIISLYYILYVHFDKFIFFKPTQNPWSPEFYVIALGRTTVFSDSDFTILLNQVESYDHKISLCNISSEFTHQLEKIFNKLKNNFKNAILRNIYYVDIWPTLSDADKKHIAENIDYKNYSWVKKYIDSTLVIK
jgi:hypothetical protein